MSSDIEKYSKKGLRTSYISTVVGISLVLFLIGLILGGVLGITDFQRQAKENLFGDVFFQERMNESDIKQIEVQLKKWTEFKSVKYMSPEAAMEVFYENQVDKKELNEIFEGENPLPPSITFCPKEDFATKEGMRKLKNKLIKSFPEQIIEVSYNEANIENINLGFRQFVFLVLSIAVILIIIAIAMINNTIRLALYSRRFTIKTILPTLGSFNIPSKTFPDSDFVIPTPTSNSPGSWSFVSSNPLVAIIKSNKLSLVGSGRTTITATQAASGMYSSTSISCSFDVSKPSPSNPIQATPANISNVLSLINAAPVAGTIATPVAVSLTTNLTNMSTIKPTSSSVTIKASATKSVSIKKTL